jgi:hypothetical protein
MSPIHAQQHKASLFFSLYVGIICITLTNIVEPVASRSVIFWESAKQNLHKKHDLLSRIKGLRDISVEMSSLYSLMKGHDTPHPVATVLCWSLVPFLFSIVSSLRTSEFFGVVCFYLVLDSISLTMH